MSNNKKPLPPSISFATAGAGGLIGWIAIHPFNTLGIRMNLAGSSGVATESSFLKFSQQIVQKESFI